MLEWLRGIIMLKECRVPPPTALISKRQRQDEPGNNSYTNPPSDAIVMAEAELAEPERKGREEGGCSNIFQGLAFVRRSKS
mmetsp:Transcript_37378/g.62806  ORF Transcript_37378/g.62806 Transcript_37378/m.62806 type:complete len:81 (+) Transcript_37378:139-381(+)